MMAVFPAEELGVAGAAMALSDPGIAARFADVRIALDEGGGPVMELLGARVMPVGVGEKGCCWFNIQMSQNDMHAATFLGPLQTSGEAIGMAVAAIYDDYGIASPLYEFAARRMIYDIARAAPKYSKLLHELLCPHLFEDRLKQLADIDQLAMRFIAPQLMRLFNVVNITADGLFVSMIPGKAVATVAGLAPPWPFNNCDWALTELKDIVAKSGSKAVVTRMAIPDFPEQLTTMLSTGALVIPADPRVVSFMNAARRTMHDIMPDVTVVHTLFTAISQCTAFVDILGVPCLGFAPVVFDEPIYIFDLVHSAYDYVPLEGIKTGMQLYFNTISDYADVKCTDEVTSDMEAYDEAPHGDIGYDQTYPRGDYRWAGQNTGLTWDSGYVAPSLGR